MNLDARHALLAGAFVALLALAGCGGTDATVTDGRPFATATSDASTPAPVEETSEPPEALAPQYHTPTAKSFKLSLKTLDKECFGSAGCNISFRVRVTYLLETPLDPSKTYELSYAVKGGEGPLEGTLEVTGDRVTGPDEEFISTSGASRKLTAVVTAVEEVGS
jgi:hypothetical protein